MQENLDINDPLRVVHDTKYIRNELDPSIFGEWVLHNYNPDPYSNDRLLRYVLYISRASINRKVYYGEVRRGKLNPATLMPMTHDVYITGIRVLVDSDTPVRELIKMVEIYFQAEDINFKRTDGWMYDLGERVGQSNEGEAS